MLQLVCDVIKTVFFAGETFFALSSFVGGILFKTGVSLATAIWTAVTSLTAFSVVLWEDYLFFIKDCQEYAFLVKETLLSIKEVRWDSGLRNLSPAWACVKELYKIWDFFYFFLESFTSFLCKLVVNVIGGIAFLGKTVTVLLFDTPKDLFYVLLNLPSLCIDGVRKAFDLSYELTTSVSIHAYVGSVTVLVLSAVIWKNFNSIIFHGRIWTERAILCTMDFLMQFWTGEIFGPQRQMPAASPALPAVASRLERRISQQEQGNCLVCLSQPRNVLYLPCRHVVCCVSCSHALPSQNCPLCRHRVREAMRIYV